MWLGLAEVGSVHEFPLEKLLAFRSLGVNAIFLLTKHLSLEVSEVSLGHIAPRVEDFYGGSRW